MRNHTRSLLMFGAACFILFGSRPLCAQEWSPAQKEVWNTVEQMALSWSKGDMDGLYKHIHPDAVWWTYSTPVPFTFESGRRFDDLYSKHYRVLEYAIKPLTLLVYDTFAVVNWVWTGFEAEKEGKPTYNTYRFTEVFKKEGTKWLLVATHWGSYAKIK